MRRGHRSQHSRRAATCEATRAATCEVTCDTNSTSVASTAAFNGGVLPGARNPITDHILEDELPAIRKYAEQFATLDQRSREILSLYVIDGRDINYYYGNYVTAFQIFAVLFSANAAELSVPVGGIIQAVAAKICELMDSGTPVVSDARL
jgi:hypothetical protein